MKRISGKNGFTLVEMTVVIMVMMTLMGTGLYVSSQFGNWQLGRTASEDLRSVYAAQRQFLADNPTASVATITTGQIIPYLTNRAVAIPTVKSIEGNTLNIRVNVSPPNINDGTGGIYDPSSTSADSLWDVGQ